MIAALSFEEVTFRRGAHTVLQGFSLALSPGEIVVLMGPSGAGKSTVLRLALGFEAPEHGLVRLGGVVASRAGHVLMPPEARGCGVVFQDLALWPHLSVAGNLEFGLRVRGVARAERQRRVAVMLERVRLGAKARVYPSELSGGERQRVAIARALVLEPPVVLLDEPLSNLDVHLRRELLTSFARLLRELGAAALYVAHDASEAAALADRIAVLEGGRIVQEGALVDLRAAPATEFVRALVDAVPTRAP